MGPTLAWSETPALGVGLWRLYGLILIRNHWMTAFAQHTDSPERQRQIERIPLNSASSQLADDSYVMRL